MATDRTASGWVGMAWVLTLWVAAWGPAMADEPRSEFFRGINLNGPPVVIDGRTWDGGDAPDLTISAQAFDNQDVPLDPPTDPDRALMIRSSRWGGAVSLKFENVPDGAYRVFLYVWEDNDPETYSVELDDREVLHNFSSGRAGSWKRLGPWPVEVKSGTIELTTRGGAANLSGVEIWREGGSAPEPGPSRPRDPIAIKTFDEKVAPILARHCLECHGGSIRKAGLSLSTEATALTGGDGGAPIEPGKPEESLLWEQIDSGEMPKGRPKLTDAEKQIIKGWIADGARWGSPEIDPFVATNDRRAGYDWWSLQPVRHPSTPPVKADGWPRNDVDRFVLAKLEAKGLDPAPEADRRTLIRRLSFDLTGLPPEPEEVDRFVQDENPLAYEKLVDHLLDSPHYGERWARHWLDVIRFGESQGFERNRIRENAWRYRDWVIDALNRDLPYDEFVRLQIAGDVLHPGDLDALIATGYHVAGTWDQVAHNEGSEPMKRASRWDEIEDLVGALGQTYLGLTIQCARCHDHKFDPITQKEYYQVAALLGGVNQEEGERKGIDLKPKEGRPEFSGSAHVIIPRQPPTFALLDRGDYRKPLGVVAPSALKSIPGLPGDFGLKPNAPEADRRAALARWLSDPRNPLPPRVMANRVWYYHFGRGLVETPSDFGYNGGLPSHPELLDYLASRFVDGGWKLKDLHRLLVNSATYRQASRVSNEAAEKVDAEARLLWRAARRRLEGEALRDAALMVAGALNRRMGGPSYRDMKVDLGNNHTFTDPTGEFSEATNRRTIYRLWARSGNHPMLESLDCPDPSVLAPRRNSTITPVQSLSMMNDSFMEKCAGRFAERVRHEAGDDPDRQIERAWRLAFSRSPKASEQAAARSFVAKLGLDHFCLVLFNTNEFLFLD
ncbi:PSD1 and planctomycete cytochrome C domain-containing protein [Tundrisphaera lichenicola]|uniref:PSD1 and planctomycete cytochrome C domain-containing protein n=1 Tax=Tundrisphaera lichenicola TaxID=2029860 RepID=UPI003EB8B875